MLPVSFSDRLRQQIGAQDFERYLQALEAEAPISLRLNPAKGPKTLPYTPVPWAEHAYYLPNRPNFALDPLWHGGAYYVQEASSMLLEQAFRAHTPSDQPLRVLDLCGAPGGKSTHLASLLPAGSMLVSNEVIRSRANILSENLQKWGLGNAVVSSNDPQKFAALEGFFDVLVIDAPCSGEGLFRKDLAAREEWSEANAQLCAERQRRILQDAWPALRPGGLLIYSTCTYNPAENEENLHWLAGQQAVSSLPLPLGFSGQTASAIEEINFQGLIGYRCMPQRVAGEGFFIAALRKEDGRDFRVAKVRKSKWQWAPKALAAQTANWLQAPEAQERWQFGSTLYAMPDAWREDIHQLAEHLYLLHVGTPLAEPKGKSLNPQPSLALSPWLNKRIFPVWEASQEEALRFLRKDEVLPQDAAKGWLQVTYQSIGLGWLKHLGTRANNYWPTEWRLRMELPTDLPTSPLLP